MRGSPQWSTRSVLAALTAGAALVACGGPAPSSADRAALQNLQKSVLAAFRQGPSLVTGETFRVRCAIGNRAGAYVCDVSQSALGTTIDHFYNVRFSPPSASCWTAQDRNVAQYRLHGCLTAALPSAGGGTTSTANGKPGIDQSSRATRTTTAP
jgi:hypothetical protein